ncbi:MAG: DUF11 domain-containing protein, partial [Flavobacteriaceae bacterium]|nr:DUF11 domain-containing protein [Flavobacteriaceae bacterium]
DTIIYTIKVSNNGPATVTNLVIEDSLPAGLTEGLVGATNGTWTAPNWTLASLASGASETLNITVTVNAGTGGQTITNTATNTQDQTDNNETSDDNSVDITVTSSDLVTTKVVDNATPNEGATIIYTLTVQNNGPNDATDVSLTDLLPTGVTYISDDSAGNYNGGSGLWNIGNIANGATVTLNITASVDQGTAGQEIVNTAVGLTAAQSDPVLSNNSDSASITPIITIDLSLTKSIVGNIVTSEVGKIITFEIRIDNDGPNNATGVQVTDLLPSGFNFTNYSLSSGTYDPLSGLWNIGNINVGDSKILLIDVEVLATGDFTNCAAVTQANETDIDSSPNNNVSEEDDTDCVSITPITNVDLSIVKNIVDGDLAPKVGTQITFEIMVENLGEIGATEVEVTDVLPSGYTFVSYNTTAGFYNENTGVWTIGTILEKEIHTLLIDATVRATGTYKNCTNISSLKQTDPDLSNNSSCIEPTPIPVIDLELIKEVDELEPLAGTNVDFTITIFNLGPSDATGIKILDLLPSGYEFVSFSATSGNYTESTGIWDIESILLDTTQELTITAHVRAHGDWINIAEIITANELDIDSKPNNQKTNEDDMDKVIVSPRIELTIPEGFSPNGDGDNDEFVIDHLEALYPNFSLEIVNRWGNIVYKYTHNGNPSVSPQWWDGYSDGRMTIKDSQKVPTGTYFYTLYFNVDGKEPYTNWIYLRR